MAGTGPLISVLCPTRKRPQRVRHMVSSALATAARPDALEFVFYADDDDLSTHFIPWPEGTRYRVRTGPRQIQPNNWNHAYEWAKGEILMVGADDIVFVTPGWDERVREAFDGYPDKMVLVYTNDVHSVQATHPFLHRRWIEALGYVCPPYFEAYWVDQWLQEVADRIGRKVYLPDVIIEHVHWMSSKVENDETYRHAYEWEGRSQPGATWTRTAAKRIEDAQKVQQLIESAAG